MSEINFPACVGPLNGVTGIETAGPKARRSEGGAAQTVTCPVGSPDRKYVLNQWLVLAKLTPAAQPSSP